MNTGLNTQNSGFGQPYRNPGGLRRAITSTLSSNCTMGNSSMSTTSISTNSTTLLKSPPKIINKSPTITTPSTTDNNKPGNQEAQVDKENKIVPTSPQQQFFKLPKLLQPQPFKPLTQFEPLPTQSQSQSQSQIACESEDRKYESAHSQNEEMIIEKESGLLDGLLPIGSNALNQSKEIHCQTAEEKNIHSRALITHDMENSSYVFHSLIFYHIFYQFFNHLVHFFLS